MTLPRIKIDTVLATLEKATQQTPESFGLTAMLEGMVQQPELTAAIHELSSTYVSPLMECDKDINPHAAAESMLELVACVYGITLKAMTAQAEADEMNEAWG